MIFQNRHVSEKARFDKLSLNFICVGCIIPVVRAERENLNQSVKASRTWTVFRQSVEQNIKQTMTKIKIGV